MERFANSCAICLFVFCFSLAAGGQAVPGQCGYERWPVKTLTDKDASRVNFQPRETTVAKLAAIPIHEIPYPEDGRIAPEELRVYRIHAKLVRVQREQDKDLHLVIADNDNPEITMIAEIPSPACPSAKGHAEEYRRARAILLAAPYGAEITIVGVAFFDFIHEQSGRAKNGIELHPVLRVRVFDGKGEIR